MMVLPLSAVSKGTWDRVDCDNSLKSQQVTPTSTHCSYFNYVVSSYSRNSKRPHRSCKTAAIYRRAELYLRGSLEKKIIGR